LVVARSGPSRSVSWQPDCCRGTGQPEMSRNQLTDLLDIGEPILIGAFGGVSSVELTATVSDLGGLGSYGLYGYDADRIAETVAALRAATSAPFAVNLWVPTGDEVRPSDVELGPALAAAQPLFD